MRHLDQILVLTEDHRHIERCRYPDDIKTEPEINPLLPLHRHIVRRAVPKTHPLDR
ncbi:MAG: hypothetical protein OXF26_05220 [Alphaproteobacteria bacterium]|nr:hypothetical protein [Alphaproteobacteria bacterium]MCY4317892.1 hypothetical protein [Alphaproteobacteria bacterium]